MANPQVQTPQNQQEIQLADIHIPAKPSAWPPAYGWWILLALLVALITVISLKVTRYRKLKKQQKLTLQMLHVLEKKLQQNAGTEVLAEINILLRRLALMHYPRKKIASLTGKEWLAFLDKSLDSSGKAKDFSQGAGRILGDAPYLAKLPDNADIKGLSKVVKKWVKNISVKELAHHSANYSSKRSVKPSSKRTKA